ncbi:MAG: hypothetical protein K1X94_14615 [Sandaracinaceae bacterium]|nr:hypothetical protein [Sandaracinaceae bacterium]
MARAREPGFPAAHRVFTPLRGSSVALALDADRVIERRARGLREARYGDPVRAFVALANRARALHAAGFAEEVPPAEAPPRTLAGLDAVIAYAGVIDVTRSLPRQELSLAQALTPAAARQDERMAEALATLALLEWPSTFDVGGAIGAIDDPDEALVRVLARELSRDRASYPKELVRLAVVHGSARSCTLALEALTRTRDPDAWLDVLIEGDPFFDRSHAPRLAELAKKAPNRDAARIAREIAAEHAAPRRRRAR